MTKVIAVALFLAVAVGTGVYFWLGGFRSVRIEEVQHRPRRVVGTLYQGKYGDVKLREIFVTTQQQLAEGAVRGRLVVVNYDSLVDTQEVNQLIGVIPEAPADSVVASQTVDSLVAGTYVRARLYGHPAVRPTPAQIHQKVQEYASDRKLALGKKVVEHYFGPDSIWVEYPVVAE